MCLVNCVVCVWLADMAGFMMRTMFGGAPFPGEDWGAGPSLPLKLYDAVLSLHREGKANGGKPHELAP